MSISYSCTHHIVKLGIQLDTCVPKIIWKKYLPHHEHYISLFELGSELCAMQLFCKGWN